MQAGCQKFATGRGGRVVTLDILATFFVFRSGVYTIIHVRRTGTPYMYAVHE